MATSEQEFVEKSIGLDTTICSRCYATLRRYSEMCSASLDDKCPGFLTIERVSAAYAQRAKAGTKGKVR